MLDSDSPVYDQGVLQYSGGLIRSRRVYGTFAFTMYVLLATILASQIYSGKLTVITKPAAGRFADQVCGPR